MSSRRSRIAVRPNVGARPRTGGPVPGATPKPPTPGTKTPAQGATSTTPVPGTSNRPASGETSNTSAPKVEHMKESNTVSEIISEPVNNKGVHEKALDSHDKTNKNEIVKQKSSLNSELSQEAKHKNSETVAEDHIKETANITINKPIDKSLINAVSRKTGVSSTSMDKNKESKIKPPPDPKPKPKLSQVTRIRFPKARPNIAEAGRMRVRHPSISASDSEDEFHKQPPPVQRLTSSSSTVPTPGSASKSDKLPVFSFPSSLPQTSAEQPPRRASRVVDKEEAVDKKRPKRRKKERNDKPPERAKMTMRDLIYYKPKGNEEDKKTDNPDKSIQAKRPSTEEVILSPVHHKAKEVEMPEDDLDDTDSALPVPQVKLGPDGSIILNEASLTVEASPVKAFDIEDTDVVHEKEFNTTYASYKKRNGTNKTWTMKETLKFYKALSIVGTDFSMMSNIFPKRSRADLKNKFKREERLHKPLIDRAIRERLDFDFDLFSNSDSEDEVAKENSTKKSGAKKTKQVKKKTGKDVTKKRRISQDSVESDDEMEDMTSSQTDSKKKRMPTEENVENNSDDDDRFKTIAKKDLPHSSDDEEAEVLDSMCKQATRSGRVPKRIQLLNLEPAMPKHIKKPSSVQSTGKDIQTVVKNISSQKPTVQASAGGPLMSPTGFVPLGSPTGIAASINVSELSPGQLVFVTGTPKPNEPKMIHMYMVSPTGKLLVATPPSNTQSMSTSPQVTGSKQNKGSSNAKQLTIQAPGNLPGYLDERSQMLSPVTQSLLHPHLMSPPAKHTQVSLLGASNVVSVPVSPSATQSSNSDLADLTPVTMETSGVAMDTSGPTTEVVIESTPSTSTGL